MPHWTPNRRKVVKMLGTGIAASSLAGNAAAKGGHGHGKGHKKGHGRGHRGRGHNREKAQDAFEKLIRKHGRPIYTDQSVFDGSDWILSEKKHSDELEQIESEGYDLAQVETIEFEDGYQANLTSGVEGRHATLFLDNRPFGFEITDKLLDEALNNSEETVRELQNKSTSKETEKSQISAQALTGELSISEGKAISIGTASGGKDKRVGFTNPFTAPADAIYKTEENLVGAVVNSRSLAYKAGGYAKVYQNVRVEDSGTLKIGFNGSINGVITSIIAGATVDFNAYIKKDGGEKKKLSIIDFSDVLSARAISKNYSPNNPGPGGNSGSLFRDVTPGSYEIGIELTVSSSAFGTSSAVVNFYPKYGLLDSNGYCDYSYISVNYV